VASALKQVPRDKVTILTKTDTRDPQGVRADLDRYRRELGTDANSAPTTLMCA
jgi:diketogulonate reductase-like aldo/keto reductase